MSPVSIYNDRNTTEPNELKNQTHKSLKKNLRNAVMALKGKYCEQHKQKKLSTKPKTKGVEKLIKIL